MTTTPQHEIDYDLAYDDGHKAAEERFAPLIEAARAYREVHTESQRRWDGIAYDAALMRLLEAARTFEVSHIEEGDDKGGE